MRKLIVVSMVSLDGYYTGPNGDMTNMGIDDGFNAYNAERIKSASTVLVGHTSFKEFSSYWPGRERDEDASENELKFNESYYDIEKIVVAKDFDPDEVPSEWKGTVKSFGNNLIEKVKELKEKDGQDIVIWGSRTLWSDLIKHGLVDEMHLVIGNGLLGNGVPLFQANIRPTLKPVKSYVIEKSKNVIIQFQVN